MADGDSTKCGLCGAELEAGSEVCPSCGTDLSLLDLEDGEGLDAIKQSTSLDDLLATVLDEPADGKAKKAASGTSLDDLDLDLEIPDEPVEKPKLDLDVLEEKPPVLDPVSEPAPEPAPTVEVTLEEEAVLYECPECGAHVSENAPLCFSCGALFTDQTFACPECNAEVPAESTLCPQCGVQFIETVDPTDPQAAALSTDPAFAFADSGQLVKAILDRYQTLEQTPPLRGRDPVDLQRSLQEYVTYLRSLITLAKAVRVPTDSIQIKIADATRRAKVRDLEGAVRLAHSAKLALEQSLALQVAKRLEMLQAELENNRSRGSPYPVAENLVQRAIVDLEAGRVQSAYERLERAKEDVAASSGGQTDARRALQKAREMVEEVAPLGTGASELQESLAQGEEALRQGNWEAAAHMAATVQGRANETLQGGLSGELKRVREEVMQLKIQGKDVTRPIALLKQAGTSINEKSYDEALRYINLVKQEMQR